MRKIMVGKYELEFDEALVSRFEEKTHNDFALCAVGFAKAGFEESDIGRVCAKYSPVEIQSLIIHYVEADLMLFPA